MKTVFFLLSICLVQAQQITLINGVDELDILLSYTEFDKSGNTSVMNSTITELKWSGESPFLHDGVGYFNENGEEIPYFKRNRDLGQTFRIEEDAKPKKLSGVVLKTGYGDAAIRPNIYGRELAIQIFQVSGSGTINTNGSTSTARHGFPHSGDIPALRDDYLDGEKYHSIKIIRGFLFPDAEDFGVDGTNPDAPQLKGRLLHFDFSSTPITLAPGNTYAFLIMIVAPCIDCGFTLANTYKGNYSGGHAIRREGNGRFPPKRANPKLHPTHPKNEKALFSSQFPVNFKRRTNLKPGTNGYPDVDTFRDHFFYLIGTE